MAEELGERTEQPTSRRLGEARSRGQVARSVDFSAAVDLIGALVLLLLFGSDLVSGLGAMLRILLDHGTLGPLHSVASVAPTLGWTARRAGTILAPFLGLMFLIVATTQLLQVGWVITFEPLMPNVSRLNPISGLGRLFNTRSLVKTVVSCVKLVVIGVVAVLFIVSRFSQVASLSALPVLSAFAVTGRIVLDLVLWMLALLLIIGAADLLYQRWQHTRDLRMTRQEVKDERRSMEGDVDTKARRLRMGRQMILQRMRQSVPTADVVVTNPTHFAVALKYDAGAMPAPKVIAKGADYMAFRMREIAAYSGVPIVEKPALARALYSGVEVGKTISPQFYQAVAEVLAYVYRLEGRAAG